MSGERSNESGNDEFDDRLARRFAALDDLPVPDLWARIAEPHPDRDPIVRSPRRWTRTLAIATAAALAIVGSWGVVKATTDDGSLSVSADRSTTDGTAAVETDNGGECDAAATAARLQDGAATFDVEPSTSPAKLAATSVALRGQIVSTKPDSSGTLVVVKVRDVLGADADSFATGAELLVPGTGSGEAQGLLRGDFVAFVEPAFSMGSLTGSPGEPLVVLPEGLWVGCGDDAPAEPVLGRPGQPGWDQLLEGGISLGELWNEVVFGDGDRVTELAPPLFAGDGTAVFDVRLITGDRFRLSVPEQMGAGIDTLTEKADGGPIVVSGEAGSVTVAFELCADQDGMVANRLGSSIRIDSTGGRFCRPDELLASTVDSTVDIEGGDDAFDIRPIHWGSRYGPLIAQMWPGSDYCDGCNQWGPMAFPEAGVVVNQTGETRLSGVALGDLSEIWTVDTGGIAAHMHPGPDGVYLEIDGGDFQRLDPATGQPVWRLTRDDEERNSSLTGMGSGLWILRSSFGGKGDDRAPLLRSINIETGDVEWTAVGRPATEWQWSDPVQIGGLVVLMDVTDNSLIDHEIPGGSLRAYDQHTGRLAWTTALDSPTQAYNDRGLVVLEFETGPALIAHTIDNHILRVDPNSGNVEWRTAVVAGRIDGTDYVNDGTLAISLDHNGRQILIDPDTGQIETG